MVTASFHLFLRSFQDCAQCTNHLLRRQELLSSSKSIWPLALSHGSSHSSMSLFSMHPGIQGTGHVEDKTRFSFLLRRAIFVLLWSMWWSVWTLKSHSSLVFTNIFLIAFLFLRLCYMVTSLYHSYCEKIGYIACLYPSIKMGTTLNQET